MTSDNLMNIFQGFRPLRTDDPESSDDDSEEDTIIALRKGVTNRF